MKIVFTIADLQPESGGPSRSVAALASAVAELGAEVELLALEYGNGRPAPMIPSPPVQTTLVPCRGVVARRMKWSRAFAAALRQLGGPRTEGGGRKPETGDGKPEISGLGSQVSGLRSQLFSVSAFQRFKAGLILHDNGLWLPTNHAAATVSRELKLPRIVSPRGMLTPWALKFRGLKKQLAWWLYQRRNLQSATVLHATSHQEAAEFRTLGLTQPIAMIPNGVSLPPLIPNFESGKQEVEIGDRRSEVRTALFLSRVHPKKGLLDLVRAWARMRVGWAEDGGRRTEDGGWKPKTGDGKPEISGLGSQVSGLRSQLFSVSPFQRFEKPPLSALRSPLSEGWRVIVAGGDENGHLAEVKAEIGKLKLENDFEFVGEVADEKKWELYRSADLFVLPTKSENFGIVIAEALACGVPVITTRGTPWEDLVTHRCGWWTEIGVEPLANALREALRLPDEERQHMGRRGRKLVEENYTWPAAAKKMVAVYRWMLGEGEKPECVNLRPET